jgi:hypothetical protein
MTTLTNEHVSFESSKPQSMPLYEQVTLKHGHRSMGEGVSRSNGAPSFPSYIVSGFN